MTLTYPKWAALAVKQTHLLIAGTTGSGKSTAINVLLDTLVCSQNADDYCLYLIDPKKVELSQWNKHPCCWGYADELPEIERLLRHLVTVMYSRYDRMKANGQTTYEGEHTYIVVDELADLLLSTNRRLAKDVEIHLSKLAQLGRAAKIHLILATQQVRRKTLPNSILANIPARLGLRTIDALESKMIIFRAGCETLPLYGYGILYVPTETKAMLTDIKPVDPDRLAHNRITAYTDDTPA